MEQEDKKLNIRFNILAITCIIIFCFALAPITLQNDTYYTIKIGELILNNGIDMQDHFSWHENLPYTYPHWAYDVGVYLIYHLGEITGIPNGNMIFVYVSTAILSCVLGISIYLLNKKISKDNLFSFIITLIAMYLLKDFIAARAQLVTFILFVWTILCIENFLEKDKKRYLIFLVIIATIIANVHIAVWPFFFVLFMPYIGEYIIANIGDILIYRKIEEITLKLKIKFTKNKELKEKLEKKLKELKAQVQKVKIKRAKNLENPYKIKITKNKNIKWLILVMVICVLTGLITPIGDTPYTYLIKTMQGNTTQNINEHLPMTISQQPEVLSTIVIILSILIFTKTKIKLNDLFMIGGLALLMLYSRRQLSMFALIGSVTFCRLITELINTYINKDKKIINVLKPIPVILIITSVVVLTYYKGKEKIDNTYIDAATYPVDACTYILENIDIKNARFYNEYNYGSYMLYRGIPVFIDSRADLYAPEFSGLKDDIFMDFINVSSLGNFYEETFEKYNITHAIMYKNAKISMIIDETKDSNYKKIYSDEHFVIYERLNAKSVSTTERNEN